MPLRESLPDELVDNIVDLLRLRAKTSGPHKDLGPWADKMLQTACRHIEYFVEPEVSVEAAAQWQRNGGTGDLRAQRYRPPSKWKRGAGLHFEQAVPPAQLIEDLVALGAHPTGPRVREILEMAEIVWITKQQHTELPWGRREDWRAVYETIALEPKR